MNCVISHSLLHETSQSKALQRGMDSKIPDKTRDLARFGDFHGFEFVLSATTLDHPGVVKVQILNQKVSAGSNAESFLCVWVCMVFLTLIDHG